MQSGCLWFTCRRKCTVELRSSVAGWARAAGSLDGDLLHQLRSLRELLSRKDL